MDAHEFSSTIIEAVLTEVKTSCVKHSIRYDSITKRLGYLDKRIRKLQEIHNDLMESFKEIESI